MNDKPDIGAQIAQRMARNPLWYNPLTSSTGAAPSSYKAPAWSEIAEIVGRGRTSQERTDMATELLASYRARADLLGAKSTKLKGEIAAYQSDIDATKALLEWTVKGPKKIERCEGSLWHKLREGHNSGSVQTALRPELVRPFFDGEPSIFLIQHDWAKAFEGAKDYADGEWPLPFGHCAFEFQINGRRCTLLYKGDEETKAGLFFVHVNDNNWIGGNDQMMKTASGENLVIEGKDYGDPLYECAKMMDANVRALCIALDAEVAATSVVRAPIKLNEAREKKSRTPLADYYIVNLAHRTRVEPFQGGPHEYQGKVRLHFRRGHWRHYEEHKTWIKWCLVGNPDLGFIDKHYRA